MPDPAIPETAELFRTADLLVRKAGGFRSPSCVVTFDSFTNVHTLDRPGFGESFFAARAIDAVHVVARTNQWYQHPETLAAMQAVHAATRPYARVVTYGSSMGGYAALRLASLAGAHAALALSPQFSIDPRVAPFEKRWPHEAGSFRPVWEPCLPLPPLRGSLVAFDPRTADARQVALFRGLSLTLVPLPGAGHPVGPFLNDIGLLEPLVTQTVQGADPAATACTIAREARRRRERSPTYLAIQAEAAWRPARRIALLRHAVSLAPGNALVLSRLAAQLALAGHAAEAASTHQRAVQAAPAEPVFLLEYSMALERRGHIAAALDLAERAAAMSGASPAARIARLRSRLAQPHRPAWRTALSRRR